MKNLGISALLAVVLAVIFIGGAQLFSSSDKAETAPTMEDFTALRNEFKSVSSGLNALADRLDKMEADKINDALAQKAREEKENAEAAEKQAKGSAAFPDEMRDYVFALIEEERALRRDESEQRRTDRQEKVESLKEGPYGNLNLKINSMGAVLNLDESQKDNYHKLHELYKEKAGKLREGIDWRDREARQNTMAQYKEIQQEFSSEVENLLTADQLETYKELPSWSRSMFNPGYVSPPGKEGEAVRTNLEQLFKGLRNRGRR